MSSVSQYDLLGLWKGTDIFVKKSGDKTYKVKFAECGRASSSPTTYRIMNIAEALIGTKKAYKVTMSPLDRKDSFVVIAMKCVQGEFNPEA